MEDRYAKALIDVLERIADTLDDQYRLEVFKLTKQGGPATDIPERIRRSPKERTTAKVDIAAKREQP